MDIIIRYYSDQVSRDRVILSTSATVTPRDENSGTPTDYAAPLQTPEIQNTIHLEFPICWEGCGQDGCMWYSNESGVFYCTDRPALSSNYYIDAYPSPPDCYGVYDVSFVNTHNPEQIPDSFYIAAEIGGYSALDLPLYRPQDEYHEDTSYCADLWLLDGEEYINHVEVEGITTYEFSGWLSDFDENIYQPGSTCTSGPYDLTLSTVWSSNSVTNKETTISLPTLQKEGYVFRGWALSGDMDTIYVDTFTLPAGYFTASPEDCPQINLESVWIPSPSNNNVSIKISGEVKQGTQFIKCDGQWKAAHSLQTKSYGHWSTST